MEFRRLRIKISGSGTEENRNTEIKNWDCEMREGGGSSDIYSSSSNIYPAFKLQNPKKPCRFLHSNSFISDIPSS